MASTRQIPWPRVLAEGAVIVASILLAFGIDALWGERSLRLEVEGELRNVAEEIADNRERIAFSVDVLDRLAAAVPEMVDVMEASAGGSTIRIPDTLAWLGQAIPPTPDLSFGALDALVSSGRLAFVGDPVLRAGLSRLRSRMDDAAEGQQRLHQMYDSFYLPRAFSGPNLSALYDVATAFWTGERQPGQPLQFRTLVDFPNSPWLRNYVAFRKMVLIDDAEEWRGVVALLDELDERLAEPQ